MITTAKNDIEQFEKNLETQPGFLTQKIKNDYLSDKRGTLNNFYCFGNCNLMLMGQNLSVCGQLTEGEMEELLSFCQFMGVYGVEYGYKTLPVEDMNTMYLMRYSGSSCESTTDIVKNDNIYQFSQFSCANFTGTAFNMVYSYFARKVNNQLADIYYLEHNGKVVSGAMAARFDDGIYLTFVSTAKKFRHQGLAKKVISHIISENSGSDITLMCEKELIPFYTKLGFEQIGETYLYNLRKEHI